MLAHVTVCHGKFNHITPILKELHRLLIEKHIAFKLATSKLQLVTYKMSLRGNQRIYMNSSPTINQYV